eukprot:s5285_g2.t1
MTGGWKMTWDMTLEELAEKQYKELQNGRLAMLAFAGMATQYLVTGHAVGFADDKQPFSFIQGVDEVVNTNDMILTFAGMAMAIDGVRRLSFPERRRIRRMVGLRHSISALETPLPKDVIPRSCRAASNRCGLRANRPAMPPAQPQLSALSGEFLSQLSSTLSDDAQSVIGSDAKEALLPSKSEKASQPSRLAVDEDLSKPSASAPSSPAQGPSPKAKVKPKPLPSTVSTTMAWGNSGTKGANKWSSTAGFKDSLTGEQISRAQAIAEVSKVHRESAVNILEMIIETLQLDADTMVRMHLLERLDSELERSKTLLLEHSKGLLSSDLAELRIQKSEKKAILDKIARKNLSFTQEITILRQRLRHFPGDNASYVDRILKSASESSSLQEFGRHSQACMLTILEQKLNSVFSLPLGQKLEPELQAMKPQSRAENSFLKERVIRLEEQVQMLADQIAAVQRQRAVLVATKEKLQQDLDDLRSWAWYWFRRLGNVGTAKYQWHPYR